MRVVEIGEDWDFDHIRLAERPEPEPGPGEVKLKMAAAAINYRDYLMVRRGYGRMSGSLPLVPLSDGVGRVVRLGEGVSRVQVGDRVCPLFNQMWLHGPFRDELWGGLLGGPLDGVMQEYMVLPAAGVAPAPAHMTDLEAATLPCAALTAWSAVVNAGRVKAGDWVLVQGTGGVSLFALQIAKMHGARVVATSSSEAKLERLRALGADHVLNYGEVEDWGRAAHQVTAGRGVDIVVEVGGAATIAQSVRAVRASGTISLIGNVGGSKAEINLPLVFMKSARMIGISTGNRDSFEAMARGMSATSLRPVIDDRVHGFEDVRAALQSLPQGRHFGKVCLQF